MLFTLLYGKLSGRSHQGSRSFRNVVRVRHRIHCHGGELSIFVIVFLMGYYNRHRLLCMSSSKYRSGYICEV